MAEEEQAWYYMADGEQIGPISSEDLQQYAAVGTIHAETEVWTEALDQWVPATHVEGLVFGQPEPAPQSTGPRLIVGAAAQAAHPLAGEITPQAQPVAMQAQPATAPAQPVAAAPSMAQPVAPVPAVAQPMAAQPMAAQPQVAGYQQPGMQQPGMASGFGMVPTVQPGEEYPVTGTKRASYGILLGCILGGIAFIILGAIIGGSMAAQGSDEQAGAGALVILGFGAIGYLVLLLGVLFGYIYIYRAWNCLRFGAPRTTAGKAIGFLFIPGFNIYWIFVALYGLAQDWNRVMGSHPNLQAAPRMSAGMFLTCLICVLSVIGFPVAAILWFIVFKQICDGVNFMAAQNMRQSQPAGMSFY